jgi:hypothetical protein
MASGPLPAPATPSRGLFFPVLHWFETESENRTDTRRAPTMWTSLTVSASPSRSPSF